MTNPRHPAALKAQAAALEILESAKARVAAAGDVIREAEAAYRLAGTDENWSAIERARSIGARHEMDASVAAAAHVDAIEAAQRAQREDLEEEHLLLIAKADLDARATPIIKQAARLYAQLGELDAQLFDIWKDAKTHSRQANDIKKRLMELPGTTAFPPSSPFPETTVGRTHLGKLLKKHLIADGVTPDGRGELFPHGGPAEISRAATYSY